MVCALGVEYFAGTPENFNICNDRSIGEQHTDHNF